jgi:hypothetical protein
MITQISGKYSERNPGLFEFKSRLTCKGIQVTFPKSDRILGHNSLGMALTYDPIETGLSFSEIELQLFDSIQSCTFHSLYNLHEDKPYIGESSSIETLFAILCSKPIVIVTPELVYSEKVPPVAIRILHENLRMMRNFENMDIFPFDTVNYTISIGDRLEIFECIVQLFRKYVDVK